MKRTNFVATLTVLALTSATVSWGAHPYVYPEKGQSPEQQQKDQYECHQWAVKQTGFDPSQPVEQSVPRAGLLGGAARGAALGVVGGAIGGDVGKGAGIGAAVGGLGAVMRDRRANVHQQQIYNANSSDYDRAYATCLGARGYKVG